jgi:hypothetical protein
MIDSYWDLYVAYIAKCVKENKERDIDPHHYEMEWNHFLPQCIFGNQPIGQYLTLKQHAIATALQTLAFEHNCLCGMHKKYLPQPLLDLAWKFYVEASRKIGTELFSSSLGLFDPRNKEKRLQGATKSGLSAMEQRTGIHNPENREIVLAAGRYALENKKGIFDPANKEKVMQGSKNSGRQAVENKTGIFSPAYQRKSGENHPCYGVTHTEEWKKAQSERMSGEKHPQYGKFGAAHNRSKAIIAIAPDGTELHYGSIIDATRELEISNGHLRNLLKTGNSPRWGKFKEWRFIYENF